MDQPVYPALFEFTILYLYKLFQFTYTGDHKLKKAISFLAQIEDS